MLHLAAVDTTVAGWPVVNRSLGPPLDLALRPPPGVVAQGSSSPWGIALPEAEVIVTAEINRHHPGWFAKMVATMPVAAAAPPPQKLGRDCSLEGPFYASAPLLIDGCIASCNTDQQCAGFTWKHVDTPTGGGAAVTPNCTGKAGQSWYKARLAITAHETEPWTARAVPADGGRTTEAFAYGPPRK